MSNDTSPSSFYNQNAVIYTDNNPAGPADTPVSDDPNTTAPSSFYKGTGAPPGLFITGVSPFSPIPHNFITGIGPTGSWLFAQPDFTDISGIATLAQLPQGLDNTVLQGHTSAPSTYTGSPTLSTSLAIGAGVTPGQLWVYHTTDGGSNWEKAVFDWTTNLSANCLTVGTLKSGTGVGRVVVFENASADSYYYNFSGTTVSSLRHDGTWFAPAFNLPDDSAALFTNNTSGGMGLWLSERAWVGWNNHATQWWAGSEETFFQRVSSGVIGLAYNNAFEGGATGNAPAGFRIFKSVDNIGAVSPINYEALVLDWTTTSNVATIGTVAGGTGVVRDIHFVTGSERLRIDSNGFSTFGGFANTSIAGNSTVQSVNNGGPWNYSAVTYSNGGFVEATMAFAATRGSNPTNQVALQKFDAPLALFAYGSDGTGYHLGASIAAYMNGTASAGNTPMSVAINTGATGTLHERLTVTDNGSVVVNRTGIAPGAFGSGVFPLEASQFEVIGNDSFGGGISTISGSAGHGGLGFLRSNNTDPSIATAFTTNATVGCISWYSGDGTNWQPGAFQQAVTTSTWTTGGGPMKLQWWTNSTKNAGSAGNPLPSMELDAAGNLTINNAIPFGLSNTSLSSKPLEIVRVADQSWYVAYVYANDNANIPALVARKSRGTTLGANVAVSSASGGDNLFLISAQGNDGSVFQAAGQIEFTVDATVAAGIVPGRATISTANTAGVMKEALRVDSGQNINLGGFANQTGRMLELNASGVQVRTGINSWVNDNVNVAGLDLRKSRGAAVGTQAAVVAADLLGIITGYGSDGTNFQTAGRIALLCDTTPSSGIVPGKILLSLANASGTLTDYISLDHTGSLNHLLPSIGIAFNGVKTIYQDTSTYTVINGPDGGTTGPQIWVGKQASDPSSYVFGNTVWLGPNNFGTAYATFNSTTITLRGNVQAVTGSLGYGTGVGGTVTQATSRTTGVTLNKVCGAITLFAAAPVVGTWVTFTVTNSTVAATDTVIANIKSGTNTYICDVSAVAAGSFNITFQSVSGTTSDSPVINYAVHKAVTA